MVSEINRLNVTGQKNKNGADHSGNEKSMPQQRKKERNKNIARNLYVYGWTVYGNDYDITERSFVSYTRIHIFIHSDPIFRGMAWPRPQPKYFGCNNYTQIL